jgi:hypothetical protein
MTGKQLLSIAFAIVGLVAWLGYNNVPVAIGCGALFIWVYFVNGGYRQY